MNLVVEEPSARRQRTGRRRRQTDGLSPESESNWRGPEIRSRLSERNRGTQRLTLPPTSGKSTQCVVEDERAISSAVCKLPAARRMRAGLAGRTSRCWAVFAFAGTVEDWGGTSYAHGGRINTERFVRAFPVPGGLA
ncbi:unnamed protein product, partial [Iphiclides podalirius]